MTYASARVYLGMASTGWWILLCVAGLLFDFSGEVTTFEGESHSAAILAFFIVGYIILGFPFDFLGGYLLPSKYNRRQESFLQWFSKWCRGVIMHGGIIWLFGMILMLTAGWFGTIGAIAVVGLLMLLQSRFQLWAGRLLSPLHLRYTSSVGNNHVASFKHMRFAVMDSEDKDFTGGVVGRPGKEVIVIPAKWESKLKPELLEIVATRRLGAVLSGSRNRGILLAMVWNLLGFSLATIFSPHSLATAAGVIDVSLLFSIFSFIGLFGVLPFFSRKGILEVDAWARDHDICPFRLQRAFSFHNNQTGDSPTRPPFIEFFCHPIPSVENRIKSLLLEEKPVGAWHVSRQSLYLSWAGLGLLSRFAHCNLGRPELWAMLPCE